MPKPSRTTIIRNKNAAPKEKELRAPAQSEQDWLKQEGAELPPMKPAADIINMAVGRDLCLAPHLRSDFRTKDGKQFKVSRFFPGAPEIFIDKPENEAELKEREAFFATYPGIYVAIKPFESISPEELRTRIEKQIKAKKALRKAA